MVATGRSDLQCASRLVLAADVAQIRVVGIARGVQQRWRIQIAGFGEPGTDIAQRIGHQHTHAADHRSFLRVGAGHDGDTARFARLQQCWQQAGDRAQLAR